jgi:hypothetical protein
MAQSLITQSLKPALATCKDIFFIGEYFKRMHRVESVISNVLDVITENGEAIDVSRRFSWAMLEARSGKNRFDKLCLSKDELLDIQEHSAFLSDHAVDDSIKLAQNLLAGDRHIPIDAVGKRLLQAIRDGEPFLFTRIGDGEGRFLKNLENYPRLATETQRVSKVVWFWNSTFVPGSDFFEFLKEAYLDSDILGVNPPYRVEFEARNSWIGYAGVVIGNLFANENLQNRKFLMVENWALAVLEKNGFFNDLFDVARDISIISPHANMGDIVLEKFGRKVECIRVPSENHSLLVSSSLTEPHYPDVFDKVMNQIKNSPPRVYLAAAGVYAKLYCKAAKDAGGIGIDVGSLIDRWAGLATR